MATVYDCLTQYCKQENKPILPQAERANLGRTINRHYYASGYLKEHTSLVRAVQQDSITKHWVVNYPEMFTPFLLALIHGFYIQRKRPRINSKPRRILTQK